MLVKKDTLVTWLVVAALAIGFIIYFLFHEGFLDVPEHNPLGPAAEPYEPPRVMESEEETIPCTVWTDEYAEARWEEINKPPVIVTLSEESEDTWTYEEPEEAQAAFTGSSHINKYDSIFEG